MLNLNILHHACKCLLCVCTVLVRNSSENINRKRRPKLQTRVCSVQGNVQVITVTTGYIEAYGDGAQDMQDRSRADDRLSRLLKDRSRADDRLSRLLIKTNNTLYSSQREIKVVV